VIVDQPIDTSQQERLEEAVHDLELLEENIQKQVKLL
jgi:hypothetical protein